ncbi:MAG: nucleotide exchange factor GrpE [Cyclobacteriaceae bacterium]
MENTQQPEETQKTTSEIQADERQDNPESFETLTGTEESKIQSDLKKAQEDLAETKDKYIRLYSEFENFRRRTAKEKLELIQSANERLVISLLPIVDDFERAEKAFKGSESKEMEGFLLIYNKFKRILDQTGIKQMEAKGTEFNADFHEAITQVPAPDESLKGKVIDVVENGYLLNDKVIRFAKVVVGN